MAKARIKLVSTDVKVLDEICNQIKEIAKKYGVDISGPIPLPTKRLKVPVRRGPCGQGSETYETWELRIHKRLIELSVDPRALRSIMRIPYPKEVHVEISIIE